MAAPYTWKSTQELAAKNRAGTVNTMAKAMAGASPEPFGGGAPSPAPGAAPAPVPGAPAPSAGVTAFAMPKTMAEAMRQPQAAPAPTLESNQALAQKNIADGFGPLNAGPADDLARNELQKSQDAAQRATLEQSALSGRGRTGQIGGDLVNYLSQTAIGQKADLEGNLEANRLKEEGIRQQNSQNNHLGLASLESTERISKTAQALQERLADKQIASSEKVSFAQLSVAEKELAQKASQFTDQLSWEKEALRLGLDDKTADRVWQGSENQKERDARATDSNLNRELQKYLGDRGLDMDEKQLVENIRQFDTKQEFDKWATQAGLDANAAELIWKSNEADVARKWESGERLSTQEHQVNLERLASTLEESRMQMQQVLNLDTMDKQLANDKALASLADTYQTLRDKNMMGHDVAMEQIKAQYATQLQQMGYTQETAMQAADLQAKAYQAQQDRDLSGMQAQAELAYKYKALSDNMGLSQQEIELKKKGMSDQMLLGMKQLGLDETKVNAAIQSQEFQDRSGAIATFMEMAGDNPDAVDRAAGMYVDLLREQGLLTDDEHAAAKTGILTGGNGGAESTPGAAEQTKDMLIDPVRQLSRGNIGKALKDTTIGGITKPLSIIKSLF